MYVVKIFALGLKELILLINLHNETWEYSLRTRTCKLKSRGMEVELLVSHLEGNLFIA